MVRKKLEVQQNATKTENKKRKSGSFLSEVSRPSEKEKKSKFVFFPLSAQKHLNNCKQKVKRLFYIKKKTFLKGKEEKQSVLLNLKKQKYIFPTRWRPRKLPKWPPSEPRCGQCTCVAFHCGLSRKPWDKITNSFPSTSTKHRDQVQCQGLRIQNKNNNKLFNKNSVSD